MVNDSTEQERRRALTSAVMDGEATSEEWALWRAQWKQAQAVDDWEVYHLIGDALRSEELARPVRPMASFAHADLTRASASRPVATTKVRAAGRARLPVRLGLSMAAAVSGVAVVLGAYLATRIEDGAADSVWADLGLTPYRVTAPGFDPGTPVARVGEGVSAVSIANLDQAPLAPSSASTPTSPAAAPGVFREILRLPRGPAGRPNEALQVLYSDGSTTISVVVEPYRPGEHMPQLQRGERLNALSLQRDGAWLTLSANLPPAALAQFASLVPLGSSPTR